MKQPEALRLADEVATKVFFNREATVAELRRLHEANQAMLEALKDLLNVESSYPYGGISESEVAAINKAEAAIAKGEQQ